MRKGNLLYTFTNNKNYHNPLVIDYLIGTEKKSSEKIIIIGLSVDDESVVIPEFIDGKKVVAIDENAFSGYTVLKTVGVPKTIERVASNAFSHNIIIKYDGLKMSVQDFFIKHKKHQREIIYKQLQGFAKIDKNKKWRKSINIIKKSKDRAAAQQNLIKKFELSDYQADIYLDCGISDIVVISYMNIEEKLTKF